MPSTGAVGRKPQHSTPPVPWSASFGCNLLRAFLADDLRDSAQAVNLGATGAMTAAAGAFQGKCLSAALHYAFGPDSGLSTTGFLDRLTVSAWLKASSAAGSPGGFDVAFQVGSGTGLQIGLAEHAPTYGSGVANSYAVTNGSWTVSGTSNLVDGDWHNVTATMDGVANLTTLYIDGRPQGSIASAASVVVGAGQLFLGADPFGDLFGGGLDVALLWGRILNPAEIFLLARSPFRQAFSPAAQRNPFVAGFVSGSPPPDPPSPVPIPTPNPNPPVLPAQSVYYSCAAAAQTAINLLQLAPVYVRKLPLVRENLESVPCIVVALSDRGEEVAVSDAQGGVFVDYSVDVGVTLAGNQSAVLNLDVLLSWREQIRRLFQNFNSYYLPPQCWRVKIVNRPPYDRTAFDRNLDQYFVTVVFQCREPSQN